MASPVTPPPIPPRYVVVAPRRRSWFGPILLIGLGVIFLLVSMGKMTPATVFVGFARYWPLLLILWGVLKLVEYMQARQQGIAAPGIGAGGVMLIVLLLIFGSAATAAYHASDNVNWGAVRDEIQINDNDDFGQLFGGKRHDFQGNLVHDFPANASLVVQADHGKVTVQPSTDNSLHLDFTRVVFANEDVEADRLKKLEEPNLTSSDGVITVDASRRNDWKGGHIDLVISVPRKASVEVNNSHGDVNIADRDGMVKVTLTHGDVALDKLAGNAEVHLQHGDFHATSVKGDVSLEGRLNDTEVSDIGGALKCDGDFFGDLKLHSIAKGVQFRSPRTDLSLARLDGDFEMSGSDLRADNVSGPLKMTTRSKDVHLDDFSGDAHIENSNAEVELHAKKLGNLELSNHRGSINVTVPDGTGFDLDARAHRGEIESDFNTKVNEAGHEATSTGTIGKGGPKLHLETDNASISLHKG